MPVITRVENGHLYDSEKARVIGTCFTGEPFDDDGVVPPNSVLERLQRTKAGYYFVYSHGGSNTRYAVRDGRRWLDNADIRPLDRDEAEAWARRHLAHDEWAAEFGEPDADATRSMTVTVPESVYRAIRDEAAETGRSMGDVVASRFVGC